MLSFLPYSRIHILHCFQSYKSFKLKLLLFQSIFAATINFLDMTSQTAPENPNGLFSDRVTIFLRHILKINEKSEFTDNSDIADLNGQLLYSHGYDVIMK